MRVWGAQGKLARAGLHAGISSQIVDLVVEVAVVVLPVDGAICEDHRGIGHLGLLGVSDLRLVGDPPGAEFLELVHVPNNGLREVLPRGCQSWGRS